MKRDVIIVGGGHNGLVAATLLARAGRGVLLLERRDHVGGAAVSESPFPGVDVRLSRYSYLVSLFPSPLLHELAPGIELRTRRISSYTPAGDGGLLVSNHDVETTRESMGSEFEVWERFHRRIGRVADRLAPTLLEPLRTGEELRRRLGDDEAWSERFQAPLAEVSWPYAETPQSVGSWGVETAYPNVWLCGAGARRGGGVSGIPGDNAARAVLAAG